MTDSINGFLDGLGVTAKRTVDVAKQIIGDKDGMAVTFRQEVVTPKRMESPKRSHTFRSLDGFADYLRRYGGENTVVLADPQTGKASAVLDETAQEGFEVVEFEPVIHPFWKPWANMMEQSLLVKDFAKFVVTQKHVIVNPDPRTLFMVLSQVRLSKNITIEDGIGSKALNGIMVETTVQGNSVKNPVVLPEEIVVRCPMFWDGAETDIAVNVVVEVKGDAVLVTLSSADAEAKRVERIQDMLDNMTGSLTGAVVTLGVVAHEPWEYVARE